MGIVDTAVDWAVSIALDDSYVYEWGAWGPQKYDCGHFVITAYEQAGLQLKAAGATYTGNMYQAFLKCSFNDVTSSINLQTGEGLKKGDVLIDAGSHAALVQLDGGTTVEAWCERYGIVHDKAYRNHPWDYVLRYPENSASANIPPQREKVIEVPNGLGKYYTYMNWNAITNMDTVQGRLIKTAGKKYDANGYGLVGNRFTVAMTSTFGAIGDYVDIYMSNGRIIHGIIADEKSQEYTAWDHNPANMWGHNNGQCIVEWVVNWKNNDNPPSDGTVLKVINLGNYFDYPEYAFGDESYMYTENSYSGDTDNPIMIWNTRVSENIHNKLNAQPDVAPVKDELRLYANGIDITYITGNLTWTNSIYELSTLMSFDVAKTDAKFISNLIYIPKEGDIVRLVTDTEVFRGVIIKVSEGSENKNSYSVVDMGWYCNKTEQTYQFKNISASDAIKKLCADLCINIDMLPELAVNIDKIYFDKTISAIISDILSACGGNYNYDFTPKGLRIYEIGTLVAEPQFLVANNVRTGLSVDYMGNVSRSTSIEDMRNSIMITSEKENVYAEILIKQDRKLIDSFGFLQKIIKIDTEKQNANVVADEELKKLGKKTHSYSFELIEKYDSYTRAGYCIVIADELYVIESTAHSISNGFHHNVFEISKLG